MTPRPGQVAAPIVSVRDLRVHYPITSAVLRRTTGFVKAVDGVTFDLAEGETVGLVGESGCGKSSIGRALIRLRTPTEGAVYFRGRDIMRIPPRELRRLRRRMQIVFQDPYGSLNPRMTVAATLAEPIRVHKLVSRAGIGSRVAELLAMVGLSPEYGGRYPHELSGGQRQRVGIARALAGEPELIVCDEPISALDVSIQAQILNLLVDLRSRLNLTYLFIAHDLSVVRHMSDRVGVMYLGKIVELGTPRAIYALPGHPYTRALLSAVPVANPAIERARNRVILRGDLPSPADPPSGCRFHTRCYLYEALGRPEACRTEEPSLRQVPGGQLAACHFSEQLGNADGEPSAHPAPLERGIIKPVSTSDNPAV